MFSSCSRSVALRYSQLARVNLDTVGLLGCSSSSNGRHNRHLWQVKKRHLSGQIPSYIQPIIQYGSDAYITQGLESFLQVLQSSGVSPMVSFVAMGLGLRLATAPLHIYAEKLLAKRVHVMNFLTQNILKAASEKYGVNIITNPKTSQIALDTKDPEIKMKVHKILVENIGSYSTKHGIQRSRILNLKVLTSPLWFYSSFAIRNNISGGFTPMMEGFLWLPNLCMPDPFWIVPIGVGFLGVFNIYAQRAVQPVHTKAQIITDVAIVGVSILAVKMMTVLPVCIPLYWFVVSATGITQTLLLRHPKVKKALGINRLPYDSNTPLRDLLLRRKRHLPPPLL